MGALSPLAIMALHKAAKPKKRGRGRPRKIQVWSTLLTALPAKHQGRPKKYTAADMIWLRGEIDSQKKIALKAGKTLSDRGALLVLMIEHCQAKYKVSYGEARRMSRPNLRKLQMALLRFERSSLAPSRLKRISVTPKSRE